MRRFMLSLLCTALAAQPGPSMAPGEPSQRPAPSALLAKAPEHPAYGLEIATPEGMFLLTTLRYDPVSPAGRLAVYPMDGPATWGPYRLGMNIKTDLGNVTIDSGSFLTLDGSVFTIAKVDPDGPARRAGLNESWVILQVDGRNFQWQVPALLYYATRCPTVDVLARKRSGWGKGKEKHFQIQLQKQEDPVDPSDAQVGDLLWYNADFLQVLRPQLSQPAPWRALAQLRARTTRFAPIPVEWSGTTWWVIRGDAPPPKQTPLGLDATHQLRWVTWGNRPWIPGVVQYQDRIFLEFWKENPVGDAPAAAPDFLCAEPSDQVLKGRLLRLQDRWYRVTDAALDPADGRLVKLAVQPWSPDIEPLLGGDLASRDLGPGAANPDYISVEQSANDALVEWKTRKLPSILANEPAGAGEDLVVRLEKGVLALDLKVRDLRARLDAAAREEAERRAQAELAARQGQAAPGAQTSPTAGLEQIADLLDQRKAILMAILGSAKQALAQIRR